MSKTLKLFLYRLLALIPIGAIQIVIIFLIIIGTRDCEYAHSCPNMLFVYAPMIIGDLATLVSAFIKKDNPRAILLWGGIGIALLIPFFLVMG